MRRRERTDVEDLFIAHIIGMDTMARGLRNAAKLIEDGTLAELVRKRYQSFDTDIGAHIEKNRKSISYLVRFSHKNQLAKNWSKNSLVLATWYSMFLVVNFCHQRLVSGKADFDFLEKKVKEWGEPTVASAKQELAEMILQSVL
ncbi:hypothetical protein PIB30_025271 [Stylosanthes scabra]|uniref:xylose isomerase n=1 Tax=Stylosanthes scabra TaxID=79078 RepID=A0ABU6TAR1_9FABA|nr:hypothetical protein [Stylosanthes scabra]